MNEAKKAQTKRNPNLVEDIRAVIEDAEILLGETAKDVGAGVSDVRQRLNSKLSVAKEGIAEIENAVKYSAIECAHKADRVVRENPYQSVGLSFGLGLFLGCVFSRFAR